MSINFNLWFISGGLVGWYVVVALLHALWGSSRGIAVWLTLLLTASRVQWLLIEMGRVPQPTQAQASHNDHAA